MAAGLLAAIAAGTVIGFVLGSRGEPASEAVTTGGGGQAPLDTGEGEESTTAGSKFGSRENPLPLKSKVDMGVWKVTISDVTLDATSEILAAETSEKPKPGHQFIKFGVRATYEGPSSGDAYGDISWAVVGSKGNTFTPDTCTAPNDLSSAGETFTDGKVSGDVCMSAPKDQLEGATLKLESFDTDPSTRAFIALK